MPLSPPSTSSTSRLVVVAAAAVAAAAIAVGCASVVGIEDVVIVDDTKDGASSGDGGSSSGDAASRRDSGREAGVPGKPCNANAEVLACPAGGNFPEGFSCSTQGCACAAGLDCVIAKGGFIGYCCEAATACGLPNETCSVGCDCVSGVCNEGRCR